MWPWRREPAGAFAPAGVTHLQVVLDPIDGTRPAGSGLEAGCVSVAVAPFSENATLGDVTDGVILESEWRTKERHQAIVDPVPQRRGDVVLVRADPHDGRPPALVLIGEAGVRGHQRQDRAQQE